MPSTDRGSRHFLHICINQGIPAQNNTIMSFSRNDFDNRVVFDYIISWFYDCCNLSVFKETFLEYRQVAAVFLSAEDNCKNRARHIYCLYSLQPLTSPIHAALYSKKP